MHKIHYIGKKKEDIIHCIKDTNKYWIEQNIYYYYNISIYINGYFNSAVI